MDNNELYMTSFYFTVTTIVTVGYGDITPVSIIEKVLCVFIMVTGVIGFSFVTGALTSIIQNEDSSMTKLKQQFQVLQEIKDEYNIGNKLHTALLKAVKYDYNRKQKNFNTLLDDLPAKLRI